MSEDVSDQCAQKGDTAEHYFLRRPLGALGTSSWKVWRGTVPGLGHRLPVAQPVVQPSGEETMTEEQSATLTLRRQPGTEGEHRFDPDIPVLFEMFRTSDFENASELVGSLQQGQPADARPLKTPFWPHVFYGVTDTPRRDDETGPEQAPSESGAEGESPPGIPDSTADNKERIRKPNLHWLNFWMIFSSVLAISGVAILYWGSSINHIQVARAGLYTFSAAMALWAIPLSPIPYPH